MSAAPCAGPRPSGAPGARRETPATVTPHPYSARCAAALDEALAAVPFYRGWRERDPGPARPVAERLAALPVLSRRELRAHVPDGFITGGRRARDGFASGAIEIVSTSGTTSERAAVVWHQPWWDDSLRAAARLNRALEAVYGGAYREAVLTSPMCTGNLCHVGELPAAERTVGNILFLNQELDPARWGDAGARRMAAELAEFRPDVLEADPAYLAALVRACRHAGVPLHRPRCIALTYEFPSRLHLREIRRAFPGVPAVSSYGSTETGHVFIECEAGRLHQNTATCHVDIQPLRAGRGDPRVGRVLVTTLGNPWFALVRFDVGDLARLHDGPPCECGRGDGLTLAAIEGRVRDLTFNGEGRAVTVREVDDALAATEGLLGYRVEQSAPTRYLVRYVAEPAVPASVADELTARLCAVYGRGAEVAARRESVLAPEGSGKYRLAGTAGEWNPEELFA